MKFLLLLGTSCFALATATDGIVWSNPPTGYTACGKVTTVFGVKVCVTTDAFRKNKSKCEHVVNVFYQLLDNDADGFVDDAVVHNEMVSNNYLLFVPNTEKESERDGWPDSVGVAQMTGIFETTPNTCDVPTNRGASATDRSTWSNKRDTSNNPNGCSNERDATTEEILHLITAAASAVYPKKWAPKWSSAAGRAVKSANGNCGWGYTGDWKDPSSSKCDGQYAYDDKTCDANCLIVEGIYWASVSYIGGLYTKKRASDTRREWLMATPDATMDIEPPSIKNAVSLQDGSPALYALVSDTTSTGHAWLPEIMPDGKYQGFGDGPSPPGPIPTKKPTKAPTLKPPTKKPVNSPPSDGNCDASSPCGEEEFCNFDDGANIGGFCEWCPDAACDDIGLVDDAGVEDCNDKCGGDGDECEDDPAFAFRNRKRLNCGWVGRHRKKNRLCKRKWKGEKISVHCPETCDECD